MSITQRNYLLQTFFLTLMVGVVGGVAFYCFFPHCYFSAYPIIPLFFWTGGIFTIRMVEMCRARSPRHLLQIYLLIRVVRMLFSIMVLGVYCLAVRTEVRAFMMTFIIHYFIYLVHDSWFFFMFELNHKRKKI